MRVWRCVVRVWSEGVEVCGEVRSVEVRVWSEGVEVCGEVRSAEVRVWREGVESDEQVGTYAQNNK